METVYFTQFKHSHHDKFYNSQKFDNRYDAIAQAKYENNRKGSEIYYPEATEIRAVKQTTENGIVSIEVIG